MWEEYKADVSEQNIVKDEVYKNQSHITIYHPGDIAPCDIVCGVYGLMFHTVFAGTIEEATEKYEAMKLDIEGFIDSDKADEDWCDYFVNKWL